MSTSMTVSWGGLSIDDANGLITKYAVCYKASEIPSDIDCSLQETVVNNNGNNGGEVDLKDLNEATNYNIAVKASTAVGFGVLGDVHTTKTSEDSKLFYAIIY